MVEYYCHSVYVWGQREDRSNQDHQEMTNCFCW